MKLPSLQFYPGDWHKDLGVQSLSLEEKGAWFEMLLMMHDSDERGYLVVNGVPLSHEAIARRLGLDNQKFNQILTTMVKYGVPGVRESDGAIFSRRMVRDEELRKIRQKAGKLGGNPRLLKQNFNQNQTSRVNQNTEYESENEVQGIKEGAGNHKGVGPGPRPSSVEECLTMADRIGLAPSSARQWFIDSEAAGWRRGDGTLFDNWVRQMTIHRDNIRQNKTYGNNSNRKTSQPSNPRLEGVHRPKTDYAAAAARKAAVVGQVAGSNNHASQNPGA